MNILLTKILAMVCLGLGSFITGLFPLKLRNRNRWSLLMTSLLCFGAGVLLATSLIHILPETKELLPESAEIVFCCGFFLLYVIDEIVHSCYGELPHHHGSSSSTFHRVPTTNYGTNNVASTPLLVAIDSESSNRESSEADSPPSQLCHIGHQEPCNEPSIGHIGLVVALSVHAILEGLAVGLENVSEKVILLLSAISCHKFVVGFSLGIELIQSESITTARYISSIAIFAIGSAAGIAIGIGIQELPQNIQLNVLPILQGLAGGTLLYVTLSEVLPRERASWHKQHNSRIAGILQLVSVLCGFIGMTLLTKYMD